MVRVPRAQAAADPTASATVVQASRFAGEAKDVAQLVATAPGVAVNDYGGLGHLSTVSIRGSMATGVLVLLDGIPLDAGGTGTDLASIPRHWVERIEVVRGAEGAHVGAGALGGAVDVITLPPRPGRWSAEAAGGSFGTVSLAGDGGVLAGAWRVLGAASLDATRGDFPYLFALQPSIPGSPVELETRRNNAALRAGALVKATRPVGDGTLDVVAQLSGGRRELPGWPRALTPHDWQEDGRALVTARLSGLGPAGGPALALRLHARADRLDTRLDSPAVVRQHGEAGGASGEATLAHPFGLLRLTLDGSAETQTAGGGRITHTRGLLGAAAADDLSLLAGRLRLSPALRVDLVGPYAGFSAKMGGSLGVAQDLSLRASAGRSFRAPSLVELGLQQGLADPNPGLAPEQGLSGDASLVYDGPLGLASVGGFAQLYRDLVVYEQTSDRRFKPFNAGKAIASGLEAEVATVPAPDLLGASLAGGYTLLVTENLRDAADNLGKWLPHRARHRIYGRVSIAPGPVELHAEVHHVGLQYEDRRNVKAIPAVQAWNAGGSVALARDPALRLHLEVRNLTDDRTLLDALGNPLPGRMVMVTLRAGATPQGAP